MSPLLKRSSSKLSKCKTCLKLTIERIKILRNKRTILVKQARDDIAKLLQQGQETTARIRVEHAFKEESLLAAYLMLEQYCECIINHMPMIESQKECPTGLKGPIASLIYAATRCGDLQELPKAREFFASKYGTEFSVTAMELRPGCGVNSQMAQYFSATGPDGATKLKLLKDIARDYGIDWNSNGMLGCSKKSEVLDGPNHSTIASTMHCAARANVDSKTALSRKKALQMGLTESASMKTPLPQNPRPPIAHSRTQSNFGRKGDAKYDEVKESTGKNTEHNFQETDPYAAAKAEGKMDYKAVLDFMRQNQACDEAMREEERFDVQYDAVVDPYPDLKAGVTGHISDHTHTKKETQEQDLKERQVLRNRGSSKTNHTLEHDQHVDVKSNFSGTGGHMNLFEEQTTGHWVYKPVGNAHGRGIKQKANCQDEVSYEDTRIYGSKTHARSMSLSTSLSISPFTQDASNTLTPGKYSTQVRSTPFPISSSDSGTNATSTTEKYSMHVSSTSLSASPSDKDTDTSDTAASGKYSSHRHNGHQATLSDLERPFNGESNCPPHKTHESRLKKNTSKRQPENEAADLLHQMTSKDVNRGRMPMPQFDDYVIANFNDAEVPFYGSGRATLNRKEFDQPMRRNQAVKPELGPNTWSFTGQGFVHSGMKQEISNQSMPTHMMEDDLGRPFPLFDDSFDSVEEQSFCMKGRMSHSRQDHNQPTKPKKSVMNTTPPVEQETPYIKQRHEDNLPTFDDSYKSSSLGVPARKGKTAYVHEGCKQPVRDDEQFLSARKFSFSQHRSERELIGCLPRATFKHTDTNSLEILDFDDDTDIACQMSVTEKTSGLNKEAASDIRYDALHVSSYLTPKGPLKIRYDSLHGSSPSSPRRIQNEYHTESPQIDDYGGNGASFKSVRYNQRCNGETKSVRKTSSFTRERRWESGGDGLKNLKIKQTQRDADYMEKLPYFDDRAEDYLESLHFGDHEDSMDQSSQSSSQVRSNKYSQQSSNCDGNRSLVGRGLATTFLSSKGPLKRSKDHKLRWTSTSEESDFHSLHDETWPNETKLSSLKVPSSNGLGVYDDLELKLGTHGKRSEKQRNMTVSHKLRWNSSSKEDEFTSDQFGDGGETDLLQNAGKANALIQEQTPGTRQLGSAKLLMNEKLSYGESRRSQRTSRLTQLPLVNLSPSLNAAATKMSS